MNRRTRKNDAAFLSQTLQSDSDVSRFAGQDIIPGKHHLETANAGYGASGRPDLSQEIWEGADIVAQDG